MSNNTWFGKQKYRYTVQNRDSRVLYNCISTKDDQESVIEEIISKFNDGKTKFVIKCNGEVIRKVNYRVNTRLKRIIDKNTGYIYANIKEMKEDLFISEREAFDYIKNLMRYEWMD